MIITLSPVRMDSRLTLEASGDVLIVNGEPFDFSEVPEGGRLPASAIASNWFTSDVVRRDGRLRLTLLIPHGSDAPHETLFPQPVLIERDGPVTLPPYDREADASEPTQ